MTTTLKGRNEKRNLRKAGDDHQTIGVPAKTKILKLYVVKIFDRFKVILKQYENFMICSLKLMLHQR